MRLISREYAVAVARRPKSEAYNIKELCYKRIPNGTGHWAADPFPIEVDGTLFIFAELFEYRNNKGAIGYTKLINGTFTPWKIVIREKYHLSFPYLFYENKDLYMCPEASQSGQLYTYKCISFPDGWIRDRILFDGCNFSDTIFYKKGNEKYGFTCIWDSIDNHSFKAFMVVNNECKSLNGTINTLDYYLTRPAGKIYYDDILGKDLMVSQICKPQYGSGIIFKEFSVDSQNYCEKEVQRLYPKDFNIDSKHKYTGLHTFNASENFIAIDLIWNSFSIKRKFIALKRIIRNTISR